MGPAEGCDSCQRLDKRLDRTGSKRCSWAALPPSVVAVTRATTPHPEPTLRRRILALLLPPRPGR